jgi:hypothetical protein
MWCSMHMYGFARKKTCHGRYYGCLKLGGQVLNLTITGIIGVE